MLKFRTLAGRCRSGSDLSGNIHAVDWSTGKALCGKAPQGRSAGWGEWDKDAPTCPRCIKKMEAVSAEDILKRTDGNHDAINPNGTGRLG